MKYTPSKFQILRTVFAGGGETFTVQKLLMQDTGTAIKYIPVDVCTVNNLLDARDRKTYYEQQEIIQTEIIE
jgi:hypothetical protein